ncbi:MAG: AI-2E family transporter, partial [Pseudomonas mandelii]
MEPTPFTEKTLSRTLLDVMIRAGLIAVLVLFCFQIFSPFRDLMLWSLILAITLYPLQERLRGSHKPGHVATLIILIAIVILMVPIYLLGTSIA